MIFFCGCNISILSGASQSSLQVLLSKCVRKKPKIKKKETGKDKQTKGQRGDLREMINPPYRQQDCKKKKDGLCKD